VVETDWQVSFRKTAEKDARKIRQAGLVNKVEEMLDRLSSDPYYRPPPFEKLVADLAGYYSRRISLKHRLVYEISNDRREVVVLRMFSHYGD
jgi:toxin YoeB